MTTVYRITWLFSHIQKMPFVFSQDDLSFSRAIYLVNKILCHYDNVSMYGTGIV